MGGGGGAGGSQWVGGWVGGGSRARAGWGERRWCLVGLLVALWGPARVGRDGRGGGAGVAGEVRAVRRWGTYSGLPCCAVCSVGVVMEDGCWMGWGRECLFRWGGWWWVCVALFGGGGGGRGLLRSAWGPHVSRNRGPRGVVRWRGVVGEGEGGGWGVWESVGREGEAAIEPAGRPRERGGTRGGGGGVWVGWGGRRGGGSSV